MTDMKTRILLFSFVLFFSALCAGFFAGKGKAQSIPDTFSKSYLAKHADQQGQPEIYSVSDQDAQDSGNPEKIKFDYSVITRQWMNFFFPDYPHNTKAAPVQNFAYITAPRYILYHSLQIAHC